MLAANHSGALTEFWHQHPADVQVIEAHGESHDVHDGVHRTYLVEAHLLHRKVVGPTLRLRDDAEDFFCQGIGAVGQIAGVNDPIDFRQVAMNMSVGMMMGMGMVVAMRMFVLVLMGVFVLMLVGVLMRMLVFVGMGMAFPFPVQVLHIVVVVLLLQNHVEVAAIDAVPVHPGNPNLVPLQRQGFQGLCQNLPVRPQVQEHGHRHVSADSAFTFQVQCSIH